MANSSTITRNIAAANTTTFESDGSSSWAYAHYSLDQALTSATQINVSMIGSGGATAADFGVNSFEYQIGTFNVAGPWTVTSNNGPITLNAGYTNFNLRVLVASDNLAETGEGVTFVVSQTAASVGLINSYWVPAQVDIFDPIGKGASAYPRTILAVSATPGEEDLTPGGTTGTKAEAFYTIDGDNSGNYTGAAVKLSVTTGLGGSSTADYAALYYKSNLVGSSYVPFTNNDVITILANVTGFSLSASLHSDGLVESGEQLLFTVSQTANSIGLVNSWAVQNIVDLKDPANAGANVHTRTITADTVQTGIEGTGTTTPAMATYKMEYGVLGGGYATDVVKVGILTGLGGSSAADYEAFSYSIDGGAIWTPAASTNFLATIPASSTAQLLLRAEVKSDLIAEAGEQLVFTVSQTAIGPSLTNSWWVPSTVDIRDANGTGATAISRTITAGSPVTGIEDSLTTLARANYNLVDGATGTGYSNAVVKVGIVTGLGGSSTADYTDFSFTYSWSGGSSAPALVDSNGLVTIPASATSFYLSAKVVSDQISESSEQLMFTVSNTGASPAITDSFWVPNIVNLQDAPGTGAVANPRHIIVDMLATTGMEGASNWVDNTSPAIATFTVTYDGGAGSYGSTVAHVSTFGAGGASAADYTGLKFRPGTSGAWQDVVGGLITIGSADASFQLASLALTDQIAETGEGITFAVSQTANSIGLVDSWWVTSTADIADVAAVYTVMTGASGSDIFTGTSAREMFTIPGGSSLLQTGGFNSFDRIDSYVVGSDKIDLPITVSGILPQASSLTADNLILLLTSAIPTLYAPGGEQVVVYTVTDSSDRYLAINSDGTGGWNPLTDTFIRLVGLTGGTLTIADFG